MARLNPVAREDLSELEPLFEILEKGMGFLPNSLRIMGRKPDLVRAFAGLAGPVLGPGEIPPQLKQLVAFVSSRASGCRYCQAHTAHSAERMGATAAKLDAAFEFETSPLFDAAERAALRLARNASIVPNAVEDDHFAELREHFSESHIVELIAVVSLFGWLNRWNDTLATPLEQAPLDFAKSQLSPHGWEAGKHGS